MTIIIDDAGSGELLFGIVIGAYRKETGEFKYDVVDIKYFKPRYFKRKKYLDEASRIVLKLLKALKLGRDESIQICRGYIFDKAVEKLKKLYGSDRVERVKVSGMPQLYTETAYLDELNNLGYKPIKMREERWGKSFFHMMNWLKSNPKRLRYAKTGWPRLSRYKLFRYHR